MYSVDNDDGLPIYANGDALHVGLQTPRVDTWVWTTQPYIKNLSVMVAPAMGDAGGFFGGGPNATYWNQNVYPDYGLNYVFLAPWKMDHSTGLCSQSGSVTAGGASHPSSTIYFAETYKPSQDEYRKPTGGYSQFGSWVLTAPAMLSIIHKTTDYCIWEGMDWSMNPGYFNNGKPFTAEASQRYDSGSNNAFLDGHSKFMTNSRQAAGTDWATSQYTQTKIVHASQYMWDYDGTFFGQSIPD
jgi:prepilin-type processing-associated H-X9-DG protein